jgi:hypothetical protein
VLEEDRHFVEGVKDIERLKKMNGKVKSVLPDWLTPHFSAAHGTSSQGDGLSRFKCLTVRVVHVLCLSILYT